MQVRSVEIHQLKQINFGKKPLGQLSKVAVLESEKRCTSKIGNPYSSLLNGREEERAMPEQEESNTSA